MVGKFMIIIYIIGKVASQETVDQADTCGGNFESLNGTIRSPRYGLGYPTKLDCKWNIKVPAGKVIKFQFEAIDIELDESCLFDGVILYDYDGTDRDMKSWKNKETLLGKRRYCGKDAVDPIHSKTNDVIVRFYSDKENTGAGFILSWQAEDKPEDQFNCDFESGLCNGWEDIPFPEVNFFWRLNNGPTKTFNTGPDEDRTLGTQDGQYVYIETSTPQKFNDTAILQTPLISFNQDEEKMCIQFWYHMYGDSVNTLALAQSFGSNSTIVWNRKGDQGFKWKEGKVELNYQKQPFRIKFIGICGDGYWGDIAIDDVMHYRSPCDFQSTEIASTQIPDQTFPLFSSTSPQVQNCTNDYYKCIDGTQCISLDVVCDGYPDCQYGDDEVDCFVDSTTEANTNSSNIDVTEFPDMDCDVTEYKCINENRCITRSFLCDGIRDCDQQDDEYNCDEYTTSAPTGTSLTNTSDLECWDSEYKCINGTCVSKEYLCDGYAHCADGEDEQNCFVEDMSTQTADEETTITNQVMEEKSHPATNPLQTTQETMLISSQAPTTKMETLDMSTQTAEEETTITNQAMEEKSHPATNPLQTTQETMLISSQTPTTKMETLAKELSTNVDEQTTTEDLVTETETESVPSSTETMQEAMTSSAETPNTEMETLSTTTSITKVSTLKEVSTFTLNEDTVGESVTKIPEITTKESKESIMMTSKEITTEKFEDMATTEKIMTTKADVIPQATQTEVVSLSTETSTASERSRSPTDDLVTDMKGMTSISNTKGNTDSTMKEDITLFKSGSVITDDFTMVSTEQMTKEVSEMATKQMITLVETTAEFSTAKSQIFSTIAQFSETTGKDVSKTMKEISTIDTIATREFGQTTDEVILASSFTANVNKINATSTNIKQTTEANELLDKTPLSITFNQDKEEATVTLNPKFNVGVEEQFKQSSTTLAAVEETDTTSVATNPPSLPCMILLLQSLITLLVTKYFIE